MFGENNSPNRHLAQAQPWQDDGSRQDHCQPERGCVNDRPPEGLSRETIVVDQRDDLNPHECGSRPAEEAMTGLEAIVEYLPETRPRQRDNADKEQENAIRDCDGERGGWSTCRELLRRLCRENDQPQCSRYSATRVHYKS